MTLFLTYEIKTNILDGAFPVDIHTVIYDHDFLEEDSKMALVR